MPSAIGGDQLDEDYAPHLWKNGKFVGSQEKRECNSFNGYTSNPLLCKACQQPATKHEAFMAKYKATKQQKKKVVYDLQREEFLKVCSTEIDEPDTIIDFGGTQMRMSYYKKLQQAVLEKFNV